MGVAFSGIKAQRKKRRPPETHWGQSREAGKVHRFKSREAVSCDAQVDRAGQFTVWAGGEVYPVDVNQMAKEFINREHTSLRRDINMPEIF